MKKIFLLFVLMSSQITHALENKEILYVPCGGDFQTFKNKFKQMALSEGYSQQTVNAVLDSAIHDPRVIQRSRSKSVFKQSFSEFYNKKVVNWGGNIASQKLRDLKNIFDRAEQEYGVAREVLVTFWGLETGFGRDQGDFNTVNALATLSHDCLRPALFQPQLLAAIGLTQNGSLHPQTTTGAWAGEIGQFQFLPQNILAFGVDGDFDGRIDLRNSPADAILSAAQMLQYEGWKRNEPWIEEVKVNLENRDIWNYSDLSTKLTRAEWHQLGVRDQNGQGLVSNSHLKSSLVAPEGRLGSAFLVYENFDIFLQWNQSLIYTLTAANLANSFKPNIRPLKAQPGQGTLTTEQLVQLQIYLQRHGHNVGEADGILGSGTRTAVKALQRDLGFPQDGWPTIRLIEQLNL